MENKKRKCLPKPNLRNNFLFYEDENINLNTEED